MEFRDRTIDDMRRAIEAGDDEALATASRDIESRGLDVRTLRGIIGLFRDEVDYQDYMWCPFHLVGSAESRALSEAITLEIPTLRVRTLEWAEILSGAMLRAQRSDQDPFDGNDFAEAAIATGNRDAVRAVHEIANALAAAGRVPRGPVERLGAWLRGDS
jgi:hypothetical protein